jgi:hypothetical protein
VHRAVLYAPASRHDSPLEKPKACRSGSGRHVDPVERFCRLPVPTYTLAPSMRCHLSVAEVSSHLFSSSWHHVDECELVSNAKRSGEAPAPGTTHRSTCKIINSSNRCVYLHAGRSADQTPPLEDIEPAEEGSALAPLLLPQLRGN